MKFKIVKVLLLLVFVCTSLAFAKKQEYVSINSQPKYKKGFKHFDYVNPKAKKGGLFKLSGIGTFDSLNGYILKGNPALGLGLIYDQLMVRSLDETGIDYPLVAKYAEVSKNNDWVKFYINKKAKFQDGKAITAQDVKFTFETLMKDGVPSFKRYYSDVKDVKVVDKYIVKFDFKTNKNTELVSILSDLPVFPKHFWKNKDFLHSNTIVPMGSGPYIIDKYEYGKYIIYKRNKNYWAKDLNVNMGQYNFDKIKYDYYKDLNVAFEAFKAGAFDFTQEYSSKHWATQYKGKNFDNGVIIKKLIPDKRVKGMQALVFNIRKDLFKNREVRRALNLAFDFEWTRKNIFYNQYKRLNSHFENSELSARGYPSKGELKILNELKSQVPKEVFSKAFKNNVTKGDGDIRKELKQALEILEKQGWKFENNVLVKNGKKFEFEILLAQIGFKRVLTPFVNNLKK